MTRLARLTRRRHALPAAAIAVALTFGLSACGASSEETTASMHTSVVQIAERAAAGDFAGALAELALLDREVAMAFDAGRIDADREREIRAAIDLVRADLEAAIAAASTPTPAPADDDDEGDDNDNGNGNGNGNGGDGNSGEGNNGNGNGNGGNGDTGTEGDSDSGTSSEPPATDTPGTETPETTTPPATDGSGDE